MYMMCKQRQDWKCCRPPPVGCILRRGVIIVFFVLLIITVLSAIWEEGIDIDTADMLRRPKPPRSDLGAFVYLMYNIDNGRIRSLAVSIEKLRRNFLRNSPVNYDIVLLVDNVNRFIHLEQDFPSLNFVYIVVDPKDWAVNIPEGSYPMTWKFDPAGTEFGFSVSYRQMSRYSAGYLLSHEGLAPYKYVIKLDHDTYASKRWTVDPFQVLDERNATFGYWIAMKFGSVTNQLPETLRGYLSQQNLTLKQENLVFNTNGHFRDLLFYGCFIAAKPSIFRSPEYLSFFSHFDRVGGFFKYRWDEQYFYVMYAALTMAPSEVVLLENIHVTHQGATDPKSMHQVYEDIEA